MSLCKYPEEVCGSMTICDGKAYCDDNIVGFCHLHDKPLPQTNADRVRSMTDDELAERNVRKTKTPVTGQYDYGESYTDYYDALETSDGSLFWTKEPAVEHELNWLKQPYKEENT